MFLDASKSPVDVQSTSQRSGTVRFRLLGGQLGMSVPPLGMHNNTSSAVWRLQWINRYLRCAVRRPEGRGRRSYRGGGTTPAAVRSAGNLRSSQP